MHCTGDALRAEGVASGSNAGRRSKEQESAPADACSQGRGQGWLYAAAEGLAKPSGWACSHAPTSLLWRGTSSRRAGQFTVSEMSVAAGWFTVTR